VGRNEVVDFDQVPFPEEESAACAFALLPLHEPPEGGPQQRVSAESSRPVDEVAIKRRGVPPDFHVASDGGLAMASEHETWIADIFSDLGEKDVRELMRLLAKTKASAQKSAQARAL